MSIRDAWSPVNVIDTFAYRGAYCIIAQPKRDLYANCPELADLRFSCNGYVVALMPGLSGRTEHDGYVYSQALCGPWGGEWTLCVARYDGDKTILGFAGQNNWEVTPSDASRLLRMGVDALIDAKIMGVFA